MSCFDGDAADSHQARCAPAEGHHTRAQHGVLRVAVPTPLRELLDYTPPAAAETLPAPGVRVRVPLGRRRLVGLVVAHAPTSSLSEDRLRAVERTLDAEPLLPLSILQLASWAADYYQHPPGEALAAVLPVALRRGGAVRARGHRAWQATAAGRAADAAAALPRAPARQRALRRLQQAAGPVPASTLAAEGVRSHALRQLASGGLALATELPAATATEVRAAPATGPALNQEQARAARAIDAASEGYRALLLDGVTGSGKTEVYMDAMRSTLAAGRQVLLLVPEIGLAPQTVDRLRERLAAPVAVLHSGLAEHERLAAWLAAARGHARVLIGTRSAVFTPMPTLGLVVVDEEHDASYKQQDGFRYSGRDVAVKRAYEANIPIVLGSATPSLESLHNARGERYAHLKLTRRAGAARPSRFRVIDIRAQRLAQGVSSALVEAIQTHLAAAGQVIVFINRRGYAPVLTCHDCGWVAECARCDARLTLHRAPAQLRCHHCGAEHPAAVVCPNCNGVELAPVGVGTQRTESGLAERFPGYPIIRLDRDSTRRRGELEGTLERVRTGEPALLVGTQMLAKGHDFPDVTLVAVLDADAGLYSADFRGPERMAQLLVQVAGRAGRAERPGEVIIQTRHPEHSLLQALLAHGYAAFADTALQERRATGLPPYAHLALLRAEAHAPALPEQFLTAAYDACAALADSDDDELTVLGPVPSPMERRAGYHRAQLLLQARTRPALRERLRRLLPALDALPAARKVRWSVDVDPHDTF